MDTRHILVWDGIAFGGGSKSATLSLLKTLTTSRVRVTVISSDADSWQGEGMVVMHPVELMFFATKSQGIAFFIKHVLLSMNILIARLRFGRIDLAIGASGPGVDFSLYWMQWLLGYPIAQLIHGPVAASKTLGRCLAKATQIFYLDSTKASVHQALERYQSGAAARLNAPSAVPFVNGLCDSSWPTDCQPHKPRLFWAASLLKWKGLDRFIEALKLLDDSQRPQTDICYIRPKRIDLPFTLANQPIDGVKWHDAPSDLDAIRARSNIFVSTSDLEPFGLSILEAMAAGHCVLIPSDGAYWDEQLTDAVNCIKYQPQNAADLATKIAWVHSQPAARIRIGRAAQLLAKDYRASACYGPICHHIEQLLELGRSAEDGAHISGEIR
jgi:glycosyltransferase involved in cell wall biosynthesis